MGLNMRNFSNLRARWVSGFTLVELMVVVLIITILTVIAVPSYTAQVRKSRRTEAKSMLLDLAAREERYMATNGVYTSSAPALGLGASATFPQMTSSNYYSIAAPDLTPASASSATAAATPAKFSFTASASGNQVKDTECNTFTLTSAGLQTSQNSGSSPTTDCW
jgi:type IV pilus assembly protein PilE